MFTTSYIYITIYLCKCLLDSRTSTSSVCSDSSVGSQETCKQGTVNNQSNKKKSKSAKRRENKDENTEIDGVRKDGGSGIFTGEGLGSTHFHQYGVVSKEALESLNSLSDRRNTGVSTGFGAGVHMMDGGYDRINNYRNSYPESVQDTPPRGIRSGEGERDHLRERERELSNRSSYESELRGSAGLNEVGVSYVM